MQPNNNPVPVEPTPNVPAPDPIPPVVPQTPDVTPNPFGAALSSEPTPAPIPAAPQASFSSDNSLPPVPSKKPLNKKLIIIIAVAVLVLAGLGVGAFLIFGNNGSGSTGNPIDAVKNAVSGNKEVTDRTDGTLDLSDTVDGTAEISEQTVAAKLNQQVNMKNGVSLMVTKVERNFTGFNSKYVSIKDGEEAVAITLVAGSRNSNGSGIPNSSLTVTGPKTESDTPLFVSSLAELEGKFDSGSGLDAGQQVSGRILYAVTKGDTPLVFHYTAQYKKVGADTDVTVKLVADITLE